MVEEQSPLYVVTGAAGFLGSQMVWHLLNEGKRVRATDIRSPSWLPEYEEYLETGQLEYRMADLTDYYSLVPVLEGATYGFHMGAIFNHAAKTEDLIRVNVGGTENFFKAAVASGLERVVHLGSASVYGHDHKARPGEEYAINEGKIPNPADPYALSKQKSREVAASFNGDLDVFIVDPGGIFGPYSDYGNVGIIKMLLQGLQVLPDGGIHKASMVHSEDVIRLCDHLIHSSIIPEGNDPQELSYLSTDLTPLTAGELMELIWKEIPEAEQNEVVRNISRKMSVKKGWLVPLAKAIGTGARVYNATIATALQEFFGVGSKVIPDLNPRAIQYGFGDYSCDPAKMLSTGFKPKFPTTEETIKDVMDWHKREGMLAPALETVIGTGGYTFESLIEAPQDALEAVLRSGTTPDARYLAGKEFDGYNLTALADILGIRKFRKGFYREHGKLKGYNVLMKQNDFDELWEYESGISERYGWYDVLKLRDSFPDLAKDYPGALLIRYDSHNSVTEGKMLRDLIVQVNPDDQTLYLGKAYNLVGKKLLLPSYFVIKLAGESSFAEE